MSSSRIPQSPTATLPPIIPTRGFLWLELGRTWGVVGRGVASTICVNVNEFSAGRKVDAMPIEDGEPLNSVEKAGAAEMIAIPACQRNYVDIQNTICSDTLVCIVISV